MNKKIATLTHLFGSSLVPVTNSASAYAPSNIALCKYWGKRELELNLPVTGSLSISLGNYGAHTTVSLTEDCDSIYLNNKPQELDSEFSRRLLSYLDLYRQLASDSAIKFRIDTSLNIPVAAGLASSACGYAAAAMAMTELFGIKAEPWQLSIAARLGSGSACRSLWHGFVEWQVGSSDDGLDSYAMPIDYKWDDLRIGFCIFASSKPISSREAMQLSTSTSPFYSLWPHLVAEALDAVHTAIATQDFWLLGSTAEANAIQMHSLMHTSSPPVFYLQAQTLKLMQLVWQARQDGLQLFFTQDAGANLKLLFQAKDEAAVSELLAAEQINMQVVAPFANHSEMAHE